MKKSNNYRATCRALKLAVSLLIPLALLTASCTHSALSRRSAAFSSAATLAVRNSKAAYETVEQNHYETQVLHLIVNYDESGFDPSSIRPFIPQDELAVRLRLLDGLEGYANALADVGGDRQMREFDAATSGLGQSLLRLKDNDAFHRAFPPVGDSAARGATSAVNALGHWLIERKRARHLPRIISSMDGPFSQICDLLIADIGSRPDERGSGGRGLRNQLWIQYDKNLRDTDAFIRHAKLSSDQRAEQIRRLPMLVRERQLADATMQSTQDALRRLAEAHHSLAATPNKDSPHFYETVRALAAEGQRIKGFYDGLQKISR